MIQEITDKYFGISLSEWIVRLANELEDDIVFFSAIIPVGEDSFGLRGPELIEFVRRCLVALLNKGGRLRVGSGLDGRWVQISQMKAENDTVADRIIETWQESSVAPDWYELWFEIPKDQP